MPKAQLYSNRKPLAAPHLSATGNGRQDFRLLAVARAPPGGSVFASRHSQADPGETCWGGVLLASVKRGGPTEGLGRVPARVPLKSWGRQKAKPWPLQSPASRDSVGCGFIRLPGPLEGGEQLHY